MRRHAKSLVMTLAILLPASGVPLAGSAFAQGSIGGPAKQTGIGGPAKPTSLMPSHKGTTTVPPTTQTTVKTTKK